jgi:hypothetical protein
MWRGLNSSNAVSRSRDSIRPSFAGKILTLLIRGRRECRMRAAPAVSCAKLCKERTRAYRFSGGTPTFPAQWLYGLYRALPGDRACLTPSPREYGFVRPVGLAKPPRDLTPTTEASGPHDFAVRSARLRQKASPSKAPFVSASFDRSQVLKRTRPAITFHA